MRSALFVLVLLGCYHWTMSTEAKTPRVPVISFIDGKQSMDLSQYVGKPVLVVNIATRCGFTPQLKTLEALYKKYKERGLVVVGIPSNDFGGQTPEDEKEVKKICSSNYGVTFPLTVKTTVKGKGKHPVITYIMSLAESQDEIGWNFEKFLIDKSGQKATRFGSRVEPDSSEIIKKIEENLPKK